MIKPIATMVAACLLLALLASQDVFAEQYLQNGAGVCKSALPVFDGNIRNRPTAISNEGTANAFVSCSALDRIDNTSDIVGVWIHNNLASATDVSCTFVNGTPADGSTEFFPRTQNYPAGSGGYILWSAAGDNENVPFVKLINFSCNLPAGVELRLITLNTAANL